VTRHILAIDQGTTGSTALVMGLDGATLGRANREFAQHFPTPGWVEHDADEIWSSVVSSVGEALRVAGVTGADIAAIGITNQRETTLLWERATDRLVHKAIVWQDRRTAERCAALKSEGKEAQVRAATGLVIDPYFSGTKIAWMLEHVPGARKEAEAGRLAFGTVDSFLIWKLCGGSKHSAPHVTDVTNASRTLLMDLERLKWHDGMCQLFGVPQAVLPKIMPSAGLLGTTRGMPGLPDGVPISGVAGDQQAALFGQACFEPGDAKCTYGTGAFMLMNTGSKPVTSRFGLLSTLGWQIGDEVAYALEGSVFIAGAAVQWLRDGLGIISSAAESEELARSVSSSDGVVFVPALSGLGAPHWDPEARGLITGLTRGSTRAHLARATLEAIAFQVDDLATAMSKDSGRPLSRMRVDGGAAANNLLMQFQSDISGVTVERPSELESTARGAAMLAGIGAKLFATGREAAGMVSVEKTFQVTMSDSERNFRRERWNDAVRRARGRSGSEPQG
jgi:glycerol kinase